MFGETLKKIRLEKGLTKTELAQKADISNVQITNLEEGRCKPSATTIAKLANALKCDYEMLFESSLKD